MIELKYISSKNTEIILTNNSGFALTGADGLTGSSVAISSTDLATHDGAIVNTARTQPRGIALYLTIRQSASVEQVKREILSVIKPKDNGRLMWTQDGRSIEISGVVEAIQMPRFSEKVVMQITIYCAQPYWADVEYIIKQIELIDPLHHFALTIPQEKGIAFGVYNLALTKDFSNNGDAAIGAIIHIIATGDITNPLLEKSDGTYFGINETMQAGDEIIINTIKGQKSVVKNGVNVLSKIKEGSTWLQMETGVNTFTISEAGGTGNMYFTFEYKQFYV